MYSRRTFVALRYSLHFNTTKGEMMKKKFGTAWMPGLAGSCVLAWASLVHAATPPADVERSLRDVAAKLNQRVPVLLDADTRVDKVSVEAGPRLVYHHTMVTAKRADVDMATFNGSFAAGLKSKICASPQMRPMFRNGVTLEYAYRASDGPLVGSIYVTPRDCGL